MMKMINNVAIKNKIHTLVEYYGDDNIQTIVDGLGEYLEDEGIPLLIVGFLRADDLVENVLARRVK